MATFFVEWGTNIIIECNDALPKLVRKVEIIALHSGQDKAKLKKEHPHAKWIKESQAPREVRKYIDDANTLANDF